jgi:hypothetical protein
MQKGINLGVKIEQLKHGGLKLSNYKTYEIKIKQLKRGEPKSHNNKTLGAKTAFKLISYH